MTVFSRRRIQSMVNDIAALLDDQKRKDLVRRLNNKRVEQALPAEMELALTWAMRDFDHVEVEPEWWVDGKKPDVYVEGLAGDSPTIVEIASTNDNSISGEAEMDKCAQEICTFANSVVKRSGDYLYFGFAEFSRRERNHTIREIAAPKNYKMSDHAKANVRAWLQSESSESSELNLVDAGLNVTIERKSYKQIRYHNFWTSRPPRTYSETGNPIYDLLRKKLSQIEGAPHGTKRLIFLADVGSRTLSDMQSSFFDRGIETHATADRIIQRFLADKRGRVEAVVVFSPEQKPSGFMVQAKAGWQITVFSVTTDNDLMTGLEAIRRQLPSPRFSGAQARSLFRQRAFEHDARGWYLGTSMTSKNKGVTYRISSRALLDFLSGRISEKQFRTFVGEGPQGPSISHFLNKGMTIEAVSIEPAGVDEDDDHFVFEFADDPAAKIFE